MCSKEDLGLACGGGLQGMRSESAMFVGFFVKRNSARLD
jgi:hypothetical protein